MDSTFDHCDHCLQLFNNDDLYRICWFTLCEVCIDDIKTSLRVEYYKTRGVKEEE